MTKIDSRKNPLALHLKKLSSDKSYREQKGEFLCDGEKLLREAVLFGAQIRAVLTSGEPPHWLPETIPVYCTAQEILDSISPLKTPQSVLFSCAIPGGATPDISALDNGTLIVLEGIQDPGNVGTVLRTANAFGIPAVLLTGNCADPYHPKTVRATMGAIFRQKLIIVGTQELSALKKSGWHLYGAALTETSRDIRQMSLHKVAIIIGSEGRGLSPEMLALCDEKIIIPMAASSESLNAAVAAAVIMWEAGKAAL